jgi:HEAT repeat protein
MKASNFFLGLLLAACVLFVPREVKASGVVLDKRQLPAAQRQTLEREIVKAKTKNPHLFQKLAQAPDWAREADEQKRGPHATISFALEALGPEAVIPMLEMLAVDGPPRGKLSDTAWLTLRFGLVEAVGLLRDPRSRGVLTAILDKSGDYHVVRAAAEALGRLGDDASAKHLAKLARRSGPKQLAVLNGIGECRRPFAADALANLAASKPKDEAVARSLIRALGGVGNAWAWQTPELKKTGEGAKVRATAAKALLGLFLHYRGDLRKRAESAILVVDDPSTPTLIANAKQGASRELIAALDALAARVASNPIR